MGKDEGQGKSDKKRDLLGDDSDNDDDGKEKSSFEQRQERVRQEMEIASFYF